MLLWVDTVSQFPGAFKRYDFPFPEGQVRTCGWIPSTSGSFVPYTELSKPWDKYVIPVRKGLLDNFQKRFHRVYGWFFGETEIMNFYSNIAFG